MPPALSLIHISAKNVADLIDAIYVQERNEDTDAQCEAAKAAWDALTDTQKELVEGENLSLIHIWSCFAAAPLCR